MSVRALRPIVHPVTAEDGTCGTCARFELNDIDPELGIGVCVGTWSRARRCTECGARSYSSDVCWKWAHSDGGAECGDYTPMEGVTDRWDYETTRR